MSTRLLPVVAVFLVSSAAQAQWNPPGGSWNKTDPADLRVMTWNIQDAVCSTNIKTDARADWSAIVRIIADLRPDVLIMQECGDNSGNGTGSGVDSVSTLTAVYELLIHGGPDPFRGGQASSFVQLYAPAYDLPYIFVSSDTDGFNRNVILSRYPFADLNGDQFATYADILTLPNAYAPGGDGGIRGWGIAEINLPDDVYAGNLVIGNSHLKAGGAGSDQSQRLNAGKNIGYVIDYAFNGAGTGAPNPAGVIQIPGNLQNILDADTPVIWGGDMNEDENTNGRKGPVEWTAQAVNFMGADGTDRDRTDSLYDDARDPFNNSRNTQGNGKLDYICWQDSIATLRRAVIFNSSTILPNGGTYPPAVATYFDPALASSLAADHRPVIADFVLPLAPPPPACPCDWNGDGDLNTADFFEFFSAFFATPPDADFNDDGVTDSADFFEFFGCFFAPPGACS